MKIKIDFEQKFPIDRHDLATEWDYQSELFRHWAKRLREKEEELRDANDALNEVFAEEYEKIKEEEENKKLTETAIKNKIVLTEEYDKFKKIARALESEVGALKVDVQSLEMRKTALENLVKLHGQEYYSHPTVSGVDGDKFLAEKTNAGIKSALNKPTKKIKKGN